MSADLKNDPIPTPNQREMLCKMIADAFVEVRHLGWSGHAAQAADLADAFQNISKEYARLVHFLVGMGFEVCLRTINGSGQCRGEREAGLLRKVESGFESLIAVQFRE